MFVLKGTKEYEEAVPPSNPRAIFWMLVIVASAVGIFLMGCGSTSPTAPGPLDSKTQASQASAGNVAMPHVVCGVADHSSMAAIMVVADSSQIGSGMCANYAETQNTGDWYVLSNVDSGQKLIAPISCAMTSGATTVVVFGDGPQVYGSICANLILSGYSQNSAVEAQWQAFENPGQSASYIPPPPSCKPDYPGSQVCTVAGTG